MVYQNGSISINNIFTRKQFFTVFSLHGVHTSYMFQSLDFLRCFNYGKSVFKWTGYNVPSEITLWYIGWADPWTSSDQSFIHPLFDSNILHYISINGFHTKLITVLQKISLNLVPSKTENQLFSGVNISSSTY